MNGEDLFNAIVEIAVGLTMAYFAIQAILYVPFAILRHLFR
jgi:hypothetical protein